MSDEKEAALARVEDWEAMYVLDSLDVQAARTLVDALAEARQQFRTMRQAMADAHLAEAEARQQLADAQSDFDSFAEHHRATEAACATQAQEIERLREQIDAMRGDDLGPREHVEYCEDCQRFFDSRSGCPTDIRADEREQAVEAQRERDAELCEAVVAEWSHHSVAPLAAEACAAAIRAARTPQEPT